jgi:hypothetical protein
MDRAFRIGFQWLVVAAAVLGGVAWFLNWLVIAAASAWLISICRQAAIVSRSLRQGYLYEVPRESIPLTGAKVSGEPLPRRHMGQPPKGPSFSIGA